MTDILATEIQEAYLDGYYAGIKDQKERIPGFVILSVVTAAFGMAGLLTACALKVAGVL